ncbi:MAG: hypothetical protein JWR67_1024 [Mucilaginibacter sp.]|nr:hypothetical protein [Mucilaginibacter sp.]MDB5109910.1 hypothetical protein [Mucilaginibacter sp.]
MKNFRQIAFGLIIGLMAIGFSAFTTVYNIKSVNLAKQTKAGMITNNFIVQPTADNFVQAVSASSSNCGTTATRSCIYNVTTEGQANIPDQSSYTAADVDGYVSNGWLTGSSSHALYGN